VEQVVLFTDGQVTTPEQIAEVWRTLRRHLPWLPEWFTPEHIQGIMKYLLGLRTDSQLANEFNLSMFNPPGPTDPKSLCHVEVVMTPTEQPRVFIGPTGCGGFRGRGGGVNFRWKAGKAAPQPREMLMIIYLPRRRRNGR